MFLKVVATAEETNAVYQVVSVDLTYLEFHRYDISQLHMTRKL